MKIFSVKSNDCLTGTIAIDNSWKYKMVTPLPNKYIKNSLVVTAGWY